MVARNCSPQRQLQQSFPREAQDGRLGGKTISQMFRVGMKRKSRPEFWVKTFRRGAESVGPVNLPTTGFDMVDTFFIGTAARRSISPTN